ncbi:MAG: hypothetical protein NC311_11515 [Muribaculaceae bacterium]|nr:hypothetical protein [Muribaculaceae bacterium]
MKDYKFKFFLTGKTLTVDWDFIARYFPDYNRSKAKKWRDELVKALSGQCDDKTLAKVKRHWGGSTEQMEAALDEIENQIMQEAVENFGERILEIRAMKPEEKRDTPEFKENWASLSKCMPYGLGHEVVYISLKVPYTFCAPFGALWLLWKVDPTEGKMRDSDPLHCEIEEVLTLHYQKGGVKTTGQKNG